MAFSAYKMVQIKRESESDVIIDDFDLSRVKLEPCQIEMSSESRNLDGYKSETDLIDHRDTSFKYEEPKDENYGSPEVNTEDVNVTVLSTATCKVDQMKTEDDIDIHYEDVQTEIDDRKPGDNGLYAMCNRNVVSESTSFLCRTTGKVDEKIHIGESKLQCKICSKCFSRSTKLKVHERVHTGERPYQCKTCSEAFTQSNHLKRHMRVHTGERPFHCKICSKAFTQSNSLKEHASTHTGDKPFCCKICSKSFRLSNTLKVHERVHTGEKPFHCKVCSEAFTQSNHLKSHERVHTGEKPFQCNICPKVFTQLSNLKVHEKNHSRCQHFKQMDAENA